MLDNIPTASGPFSYAKVDLIRVVDGDTVVVRFNLPFGLSYTTDVRLQGINSPEKVGVQRAAGYAATDYLRTLILGAETFTAETHKTEKYGRYLAQIWMFKAGKWTNLSVSMIEAGHAVAYDGGKRV